MVTTARVSMAELKALPLTYAEVGGTAGALPDGYHHVRRRAAIGAGPTQFQGAGDALMTWQLQRRAGVHVLPSSPRVDVDVVADLRIGVGPLCISAPVRVVRVIADARRRGFAYGTLPGHPQSGEEQFVVELDASGIVTLTITAFSRPAWLLARAAGPLVDLAQRVATGRYLRALRMPLTD